MTLKVEEAAVKVFEEVFSLPPPARHGDVVVYIKKQRGTCYLSQNREYMTHGFRLSDGTFATRKEAARIAFEAGQIQMVYGCPSSLMSEHLW